MPTLNYNPIPSVEPLPSAPSNFQTVQARPQAFGAPQGQALEEIGQRFEQAGNKLADVAIARQGIFNQVAADDATNNWQDATNKLLYGDPNTPGDTGFYGMKGKAAMDAFPDVRKQLDTLLQQHRGVLQNPMQQLRFDQETRRIRQYLMAETGRHYDQENNRWTQSVYQGKLKLAEQGAAQAVANSDADKLDEFLKQGTDAIVKSSLAAGHSEEEARAQVENFTTSVIEMQADKLSADDPRAALQFIQDHRDQFKDPEKYLQLQNRVKTKALAKEAQDIANGVPPSGSSLVRGGALSDIKVPLQYQGLITNAATNNGVPEELLTRVLHAESGFNPNAVSPTGARGIAQFIQSTADQYGVDKNNEKSSINGAARYLSDLHKQTGSWAGALSKYLGSDATKDPSYRKSGAIQLAQRLDLGGDTAAQVTAPSGNITMTEGDSIGVGFKNTGLQGNPVGGRNPQAVLDNINNNLATNPDYYKGQTVLLSGGTMNDPQGALTELIRDQIKTIQNAGGNVILAGADTGKFAPRNAQLEQIAKDAGVPFAGPLPTKNIHLSAQGYKQYADTAVKLVQAKAPDQLILPPNDPGEYPDAEVPGLLGEIKRIGEDPRIKNAPDAIKGDLFNAAIKAARTKYNMLYTEQTRQRQQAEREQKAGIETAENDYIARLFPKDGSPSTVTAQEIANDPRLVTPESKQKMISWFERETKPDPLKNVSALNAMKLFSRITEEWGNPNKITTTQPIEQAFVNGDLTKEDFKWLREEVVKQRTDSGNTLQKTRDDFLKGYEFPITKSNPLLGQVDQDGMIQYSRFKFFVDQEVARAEKDGKNPVDLFNPSSPIYLGKPDIIARFQKPLDQSTKDVAKRFQANPTYNSTFGPTFTAPIPAPPRQPGESPADYEKRTGR